MKTVMISMKTVSNYFSHFCKLKLYFNCKNSISVIFSIIGQALGTIINSFYLLSISFLTLKSQKNIHWNIGKCVDNYFPVPPPILNIKLSKLMVP